MKPEDIDGNCGHESVRMLLSVVEMSVCCDPAALAVKLLRPAMAVGGGGLAALAAMVGKCPLPLPCTLVCWFIVIVLLMNAACCAIYARIVCIYWSGCGTRLSCWMPGP